MMTRQYDHLVKVADGLEIEMCAWGVVLSAAGIRYWLVGVQTAELEVALPDSVGLWVHPGDVAAAKRELAAQLAATSAIPSYTQALQ